MHRKIFVDAAEGRNEVIFESSDGPFSRILPVHVGWHKLVINSFTSNKL
jgi:hypothetical protein